MSSNPQNLFSISWGSLSGPRVEVSDRPTKRGDCLAGGANEQRPCKWETCRYHLGLNNPSGMPSEFTSWSVQASCALDVADAGAQPHVSIAKLLQITEENSRKIEERALRKLRLLWEENGE